MTRIQGYVKQNHESRWIYAIKMSFCDPEQYDFFESERSYEKSSEAAQALSERLRKIENLPNYNKG